MHMSFAGNASSSKIRIKGLQKAKELAHQINLLSDDVESSSRLARFNSLLNMKLILFI